MLAEDPDLRLAPSVQVVPRANKAAASQASATTRPNTPRASGSAKPVAVMETPQMGCPRASRTDGVGRGLRQGRRQFETWRGEAEADAVPQLAHCAGCPAGLSLARP
jgi:hypothetical protein